MISIHAPRMGCDAFSSSVSVCSSISIHAPRMGCDATRCLPFLSMARRISIHAPRMGCDVRDEGFDLGHNISIHAPRMGCDFGISQPRRITTHFNPRTPYGVRRIFRGFLPAIKSFQSTHPVWGATAFVLCLIHIYLISIHAPRMGCDVQIIRVRVHFLGFQSTHPVWGATVVNTGRIARIDISIHAPRMGCDVYPALPRSKASYFNPRTPYGVRRTAL